MILASAIALSMNGAVLASEEAAVDGSDGLQAAETCADAGGQASLSSTEQGVAAILGSASSAGDPISWNSIQNKEWVAPLFQYHIDGSTSEHLANGKSYEVSANGGKDGTSGVLLGKFDEEGKPTFGNGVSSNVFKVPQKKGVDDGSRLIVIYRLFDGNDDEYSYLPFSADGRPYVYFDGRRVGTKESAKERNSIEVAAALVKYDSKTGEVTLIANSGSMNAAGAKAKPMLEVTAKPNTKTNLYATVSFNFRTDKKTGKDYFVNIVSQNKFFKEGRSTPYFTVKIKVNDDKNKTLKAYKSRLKWAKDTKTNLRIGKFPFRFEIKRAIFADIYTDVDDISRNIAKDAGLDHSGGYRHGDDYYFPDGDYWGWNQVVAVNENTHVKIKNQDGDIKVVSNRRIVQEYNKNLGKYVNTGKIWSYKMKKAGKTGSSKIKKGDYTTSVITDPSGSSEGILILTPCGNFEGYSVTFRTVTYENEKGEEVKETRGGIYVNDKCYFVLSED